MKVCLTLIDGHFDIVRQCRQLTSFPEGQRLLTGRIVKCDAVFAQCRIGRRLGDRLLVIDLRALLSTHLWQAELRQRQGFRHPQLRSIRGPFRGVGDGQWLIRLAWVDETEGEIRPAASGIAQEGQDRPYRRLGGSARNIKARLAEIIQFHGQARRAAVMRPAVNPCEALAILESKALVSRILIHGGVRRKVTADDFDILARAGIAGSYQRQGQERQWMWLHQERASSGGVIEIMRRISPQHFIGMDRGPIIRRIRV